eukprot:COSAG01_NODE_38269_length_491_cov_16.959184_1_plen_42_part_01
METTRQWATKYIRVYVRLSADCLSLRERAACLRPAGWLTGFL